MAKADVYYNGVKNNDIFADLLLMKAACIMNKPPQSEQDQIQNFAKAFQTGLEAEKIVISCFGPYHEKLLEVYTVVGQIALALGKGDMSFAFVKKSLEVVEKVHGKESEHYIAKLEEMVEVLNSIQ